MKCGVWLQVIEADAPEHKLEDSRVRAAVLEEVRDHSMIRSAEWVTTSHLEHVIVAVLATHEALPLIVNHGPHTVSIAYPDEIMPSRYDVAHVRFSLRVVK